MDSRECKKLPCLVEQYDFVIVNDELFEDFDSFKNRQTTPGISLVESNVLLEHWMRLNINSI